MSMLRSDVNNNIIIIIEIIIAIITEIVTMEVIMDDDGYGGGGVTTRPPANDDTYKYEIIGASQVSQVSQASQASKISQLLCGCGSAGDDEMTSGGFKIYIEHATNMWYSSYRRDTYREMHSSPDFDNDFGQQVKLLEDVVWTSAMSGASSVYLGLVLIYLHCMCYQV